MLDSPDVSVADLQQHALDGLLDLFADLETPTDDAACIDHLEALERIKSAAAAAQARLTDQLDQHRAGTGGRRDASLGAEIGLARHESPHHGRRHLGLARALLHDLPHTYAALQRGDLSERDALIIATETSHLTREHRLLADTELAADPAALDGLGETRLQQEARRIVLRLDEHAALARRRHAHTSRRVTGRLLPDGMAQVNLTIADWQYAAIMTSLAEAAARARACGDDRTRGQFQADTAVQRLTGQTTATAVPVALKIVQSAQSLVGGDCTPAWIPWCGHVPATLARDLATAAPDLRSTIQRLFHFPDTGALIAMERHADQFPPELRDFIALRDQTCRTPWCNAPIRHTDHPLPRARGGDTSAHNGQGLCESCNYLKEHPGWRHRPVSEPMDPHTVDITTPTGHRHRSTAPSPPVPPPDRPRPRVDLHFTRFVLVA